MDCPALPEWAEHRCLTMELRGLPPECRAELGFGVSERLRLPPPPELGQGDTYEMPNALVGEHFVVRWVDGLDEAGAQALLQDFEDAYAFEVEELGWAPPESSTERYFNVYLGDEPGGPRSYGAAGYFNYDAESWPMIVMAPSTVANADSRRSTAAHELNHAIQSGLGTYQYDWDVRTPGAWIWEATATWMEGEFMPDYDGQADFVWAVTMFPDLPVDLFDYPDTGDWEEFHQYGAFLFLRYISENGGDGDFIRRWWSVGDPVANDPLADLDALLRAEGSSLEQVVRGYAVANVSFDYEQGPLFLQKHIEMAMAWPGVDRRVAAFGSDMPDWDELPEGPSRWGTVMIQLNPGDGEDLQVGVLGDEAGSRGSPASWAFDVVRVEGGQSAEVVPLEPGEATWLDGMAEGDSVWLLATAWSAERVEGESFGLSYLLDSGTDGDSSARTRPLGTEDPPRACGCGGGSPAGLALALGAALLQRRSGVRERCSRRHRKSMASISAPNSTEQASR